jgi:hypothetical protein
MRSFKGYFSLLVLATLVFSCAKEPHDIGTGVIPPNSKLEFAYDTVIYVEAYSFIEDSVRTDETSLNVLGSYWDPTFGITTASFYTQLRLSSTGHSYGTSPVVDSAFITLSYSGSYADTIANLTLKIHELNDTIGYSTEYYSNSNLAFDAAALYSAQTLIKPSDSILIDTTKVSPRLQIRIDQTAASFIQKLLTANETVMGSNVEFTKYIKGLYFTVENASAPDQGILAYVNLEAAISGLTLHYHNTTDTLSFQYVFGSSAARFNNYNHFGYQHADPIFKQQVLQKDTSLGKDFIYVQATAGVKTFLRFPDLSKLKYNGKAAAINEARLVFYDTENNQDYKAPGSLLLIKETSSGDIGFLPDQYINETYYGGYRDSTNYNYSFRVTRYIQSLVLNNEPISNRLLLQAPSSAVRGHRMIIGGSQPSNPNFSAKGIKLQVLFTKF